MTWKIIKARELEKFPRGTSRKVQWRPGSVRRALVKRIVWIRVRHELKVRSSLYIAKPKYQEICVFKPGVDILVNSTPFFFYLFCPLGTKKYKKNVFYLSFFSVKCYAWCCLIISCIRVRWIIPWFPSCFRGLMCLLISARQAEDIFGWISGMVIPFSDMSSWASSEGSGSTTPYSSPPPVHPRKNLSQLYNLNQINATYQLSIAALVSFDFRWIVYECSMCF